jgi:hypothetical protein
MAQDGTDPGQAAPEPITTAAGWDTRLALVMAGAQDGRLHSHAEAVKMLTAASGSRPGFDDDDGDPGFLLRLMSHRKAFSNGQEPRPEGPELYAWLEGNAAAEIIDFNGGQASIASNLATDLVMGAGWEAQPATGLAAKVAASAVTWGAADLSARYRARTRRHEVADAGLRTKRRAELADKLADEQWARREVAAREWAQAAGERAIITHAELVDRPVPEWIMPPCLTVGVHGVAGPPEAGKSLLVRDWNVQVAASGRNALYAISEGHHDLADRFAAHPQIGAASGRLHFLTDPLSLTSDADVGWLIDQWSRRGGLALAVFDMVYGFGMSDDSGMKDVAPVLGGCRRIALALKCAVVVTGHPPLNGDRRFRGSGMWRGAFDSEYHLADGLFSCEKHKYADKSGLGWSYVIEFPHLAQASAMDEVSRYARQMATIADDLRRNPGESDAKRARRLAPSLKVTPDYLRRLIREAKKA